MLSRRLAWAGGVACAVVAASGCGTSSSPDVQPVRIQLKDFRIEAPARVRSGEVELIARNSGPTDHELLVVAESEDDLPLRADGLTVDEDALGSRVASSFEPFHGGSRDVLRTTLRPGRYVLLCNMSGHYLGGMRAELEVRP